MLLGLSHVSQRHKVSKAFGKMVPVDLAEYRAITDLQFVKNSVSAKCNCIAINEVCQCHLCNF